MQLKDKIIVDTLKDFDRAVKKQIETLVGTGFYDKKIFCGDFWAYINKGTYEIKTKAQTSISNLYKKL